MNRKSLSKVLSVTMAMAMTLSVFAGCAKKEVKQAPSSGANVSADAPGWKADTSPVNLDWYIHYSWFGAKWGEDPTSKYITEKTGVNVNFVVPAGNENEKLNTMMASGQLPDIITIGWWEDGLKKMIEGGLVHSLNDLADKYDPYFYNVASKEKLGWYTKEDGKVYGYPNNSYTPEDYSKITDIPSNETFLVKKDMYEAIGSPDMSTPEGFLGALKAAKEKFGTVNGQPLIPFGVHEFTDSGNYSLESFLQNWLAIPQEKDGKLYDRSTDPEYVKWLKVFREANEMGLISKDIFTDKRSQMEEKIAQGRYFAMMYQRTDLSTPQQALFAKDPNSVYIAVQGPANSNGDAPRLAGPGIAGWTVTLVSKTAKNPDRAMRFLTYLISEEGQKDFYLGKKGVTWDTIDGKDQFLPEALNLRNTNRPEFDKQHGADNKYWMLMDNAMQVKWEPDLAEPFKQMMEFTYGKSVSYAPYTDINPPADSKEGIIGSKISERWGRLLPRLILAKTEAEFDKLWNDFQEERNKLGVEEVRAYQQNRVNINKEKLGTK
jgi:putative aldouronate transport system substrate-binding protein